MKIYFVVRLIAETDIHFVHSVVFFFFELTHSSRIILTGEKHFVCPFEGCGKASSFLRMHVFVSLLFLLIRTTICNNTWVCVCRHFLWILTFSLTCALIQARIIMLAFMTTVASATLMNTNLSPYTTRNGGSL